MIRRALWLAWIALSLAAFWLGVVLAVVAPNGLPGVILCFLAMFSMWGWIESQLDE